MVASVEVSKSLRECSGPEAYFARLIACDGFTAARAYRIAWKSDPKNASDIAPRVLARAHVAAKIRELKAQADRDALMTQAERQRLLADTARRTIRAAPSHADRIAAIRESAILAGERNELATVTADVSITSVLRAIERTSYVSGPANNAGIIVDVGGVPAAPAETVALPEALQLPGATLVSPDEQKPYVSAGDAKAGSAAVVVDSVFSGSYEE